MCLCITIKLASDSSNTEHITGHSNKNKHINNTIDLDRTYTLTYHKRYHKTHPIMESSRMQKARLLYNHLNTHNRIVEENERKKIHKMQEKRSTIEKFRLRRYEITM